VIPFDLAGGWILLGARVNRDSATLILNTGGSGVQLDPGFAQQVGAKPDLEPVDAADTARTYRRALVDTIRVNDGVELRNYRAWLISTRRLSEADGRLVHGMLGDDILGRLTVEIDYNERFVRLYDPNHYSYAGPGVILPLLPGHYAPVVRGLVIANGQPPVEARLLLQTGTAHSCFLFQTAFVTHHNLAEMIAPTIEGPFLSSPRGPVNVTIGRLREVRLGALTIDSPTVALHRDSQFVANTEYDGVIGNRVFHGTRLILDYARHRAIIEPGARLGQDCGFDQSGLVLRAHAPSFRTFNVDYVVPHSPAGDAGVRRGDELVSVDGRATVDLDLEDLRQALSAEGAVRELRVARGADTILVTLKLRPLF
jgi:hypothetical protein